MKYQYLAPQARERYNGCLPHRVLTPDGGVIFCITEADANRIVSDMNDLCDMICVHPNSVHEESQRMTTILDAWQSEA